MIDAQRKAPAEREVMLIIIVQSLTKMSGDSLREAGDPLNGWSQNIALVTDTRSFVQAVQSTHKQA